MTTTEIKKYKVFIPTAGTGSRLNNLTKYLNKSLVSVENKPVISRIIEMFPDETEFVIALGYKGDLVKQFLQIAYPERIFYFKTIEKYEGEDSGLGLTLLSCEDLLQEPFIFCSCDTIVKEQIPYPNRNIVGYAKRENKNEYRTIEIKGDKATNIYEKGVHTKTSRPYIGLACIYDWKTFWAQMHKGTDKAIEVGESYALTTFAQNGDLFAKEFTWFDTGNEEELKKTKEYFRQENSPNILSKDNEAIWFIDNKVIKYSDDQEFIKNRIKRSELLKNFVPQITVSSQNMYCYKRQDGVVLSKITDINIFKKLLEYSEKFWEIKSLNNSEKENFCNTCKNFYYTKTINRINLYYEKFEINDDKTIINNEETPTLQELLKEINWESIFNGLAGRFHGDFHFENILYNGKSDTFTFLDWRQTFGNSLTIGDIYYDFAKLLHGLIICHELIAKDKYTVNINGNIVKYSFERKPILIECEEYFYKWLNGNNYDIKKVKILTALIYLNIAALHHFPYCHLLYNLGKRMLYDNLT